MVLVFESALILFQALTAEPNNPKAIYRRAAARLELGDLAGAEKDLLHAREISPHDEAVKATWDKLRLALKAIEDKEREKFRGMFDRVSLS